MIRNPRRVSHVALLTGALTMATVAGAAGLSDKPPQGVSLANTGWYIDPYRTDDPVEVIEKATDNERRRRENTSRGLPGGSEDPWERGGRGDDPWSGEQDSDRGSLPGRRRSTDVDIDPTGTSQSASVQLGSMGRRSPFLDQLKQNPDKLSFTQVDRDITISADGVNTTTCGPGGKIPVTDAYGEAQLTCGWDGRAWVVETTRGEQFTRKDRYELSKDGKVLKHLTTATAKGMPKIRIHRTYTLAGS